MFIFSYKELFNIGIMLNISAEGYDWSLCLHSKTLRVKHWTPECQAPDNEPQNSKGQPMSLKKFQYQRAPKSKRWTPKHLSSDNGL